MSDMQLGTMYQRAQAALQARDFVGAEAVATRILASRRHDPNALLILVQVYRNTWQLDRAVEFQAKVVQQQPKNAGMRIDLANMLIDLGRLDKALAQYDKALKLDPNNIAAVSGKGTIYSMQNKYERVRRLLKADLGSACPPAQTAWLCLHVLNRAKEYDRAIEMGRRVVETYDEPTMGLRTSWFELARAYERTQQYPEAFEAAARGNAMLRVPFSVDDCIEQNSAIIATFTPERLAAIPRPTESSEIPIFVVGIPRCGSTLTERIISAHPQTHGAGEHIAMFRLTQELPQRIGSTHSYPQCIEDLDQDDVEALSAWYLNEMTSLAPCALRVSNKDLGNFLHLGFISALFPRARIIHCRRNPIDTCLSCYMEPLPPGSVPYATELDVLGRYYRDYLRLMEHWRQVLDPPMLEIDYEELITDQEAQTRRIIDFCGLEWDDVCMRPHESKRTERTLSLEQVRKPLYTSSIGRAERFGALLDPLRDALGPLPPAANR